MLAGRQANGIWPWSGGKAGAIHSISERYGIRGAVVSAVDVINGLGKCMGLDAIRVPGATGYIDTDYEGKADAVLAAFKAGYDFVYVHLEATDEVSHAQDTRLKIRVIEEFDRRIIGRVMDGVAAGLAGPQTTPQNTAYCVLPDHPVPIAIGKHTRTPVPVAVWQPGAEPDAVTEYNELSAPTGTLGHLKKDELIDLLLRG